MNSTIIDQSSLNLSKASQNQWGSDLDPMLEGGAYRVAFRRECSLEVRRTNEQGNEYGTRQMLNIRIMISPTIQNYTDAKIQISCEDDLYMVYQSRLDAKKFERIKKLQSLNFNFSSFLNMLIKLLGYCDKYPTQYACVLYISQTSSHRLTILENMEYKKIQLLALDFFSVDEQFNRQYLSFRFSILKAKNQELVNSTRQMISLVKLKNPNLLQHIAKKTNSSHLGTHNFLANTTTSNISIGYHKSVYR